MWEERREGVRPQGGLTRANTCEDVGWEEKAKRPSREALSPEGSDLQQLLFTEYLCAQAQVYDPIHIILEAVLKAAWRCRHSFPHFIDKEGEEQRD